MNYDLLFRAVFSTLWLIFIANQTWARYSVREPKSKPSIDQTARHERQLHIVALALFAPFWFGGIILYAIFPSWVVLFHSCFGVIGRLVRIGFTPWTRQSFCIERGGCW